MANKVRLCLLINKLCLFYVKIYFKKYFLKRIEFKKKTSKGYGKWNWLVKILFCDLKKFKAFQKD